MMNLLIPSVLAWVLSALGIWALIAVVLNEPRNRQSAYSLAENRVDNRRKQTGSLN